MHIPASDLRNSSCRSRKVQGDPRSQLSTSLLCEQKRVQLDVGIQKLKGRNRHGEFVCF